MSAVADLDNPTVASLLGACAEPDLRDDLERLLAHCLQCRRERLRAAPEAPVAADAARRYDALATRLRAGEPLAYLLGSRGFWTLDLDTDSRALIPRPETELLVEWALELPLPTPARIVDAGVGSGAIALALAATRPEWMLLGVDRSLEALQLAEANRRRLGLNNVRFAAMNWCRALSAKSLHLLIANPPYVDANSPLLERPPLRCEPRLALAADESGLSELRKLIEIGRRHLLPDCRILLEHGSEQGAAVRALLQRHGYADIQTRRDLAGLERATGARAPT